MFPTIPFDIRRKANQKWHDPRRYSVREFLLMGRTMMFCVFPLEKFTEEAWSAGIITLRRRHKMIHDTIRAGELIKNEERTQKLAAKLKKKQEESKVEDKKAGSNYSYSHKLADLPVLMTKLNLTDIDEHGQGHRSGSKNEINSGATTHGKGRGGDVGGDVEGFGQSPSGLDIGSFRGRLEDIISKFPSPPSTNSSKRDKGKGKAVDDLPDESGQYQGVSESKNNPNLGATKLDKGKGRAVEGYIDLEFPFLRPDPGMNAEAYLTKGKFKGAAGIHETFIDLHGNDGNIRNAYKVGKFGKPGLKRQIKEEGDLEANSTAPARDRPRAPTGVSLSDATGSEKFATAPQSPVQSSEDKDTALRKKTFGTIQRAMERSEDILKAH
ncbi:hypothetical protein RUND412_000382 [Rhizina undulata]